MALHSSPGLQSKADFSQVHLLVMPEPKYFLPNESGGSLTLHTLHLLPLRAPLLHFTAQQNEVLTIEVILHSRMKFTGSSDHWGTWVQPLERQYSKHTNKERYLLSKSFKTSLINSDPDKWSPNFLDGEQSAEQKVPYVCRQRKLPSMKTGVRNNCCRSWCPTHRYLCLKGRKTNLLPTQNEPLCKTYPANDSLYRLAPCWGCTCMIFGVKLLLHCQLDALFEVLWWLSYW